MSFENFGMDVGVKRTRSFTGENPSALAKSAGRTEAEPEQSAPVRIKVDATLEGDTYTLVVTADGQNATRTGVEPDDLADVLATIIERLSKAVAAGDLKKHRQPQEPTFRGNDFTRKNPRDVFSG